MVIPDLKVAFPARQGHIATTSTGSIEAAVATKAPASDSRRGNA